MAKSKRWAKVGLNPKNHPRSVAWKVDSDYYHQLSEDEKAWLADFYDRYYGADFREADPEQWPVEARRERYQAKNVANKDLYSFQAGKGILSDLEEFEPGNREHSWSATPAYLDSPEYKQALAEFRATLAPGLRALNPKETPEHLEAKERLRQVSEQEEYPVDD